MKCDWIFLSQDKSRHEETMDERAIPQIGDGRMRNGKGYEVAIVIDKRSTSPNPLVIAVEWAK